MMGRKTLGEVRAELEAVLDAGPTGKSEVAESLRRFLAGDNAPDSTPQRIEGDDPSPLGRKATQPPAVGPGR
jgi:hypothetical protein